MIYAITGENIYNWPYGHSTIFDTINLPDLQQKFPLGAQYGTIKTGFNSDGKQTAKSTNLGEYGGNSEVTLSVETMPSHNHDVKVLDNNTTPKKIEDIYRGGGKNSIDDKRNITEIDGHWKNNTKLIADNSGGSKAHNNMPPFLAINFIIKYK